MKDLNTLIDAVRDCEAEALEYAIYPEASPLDVALGFATAKAGTVNAEERRGFKAGHRAACDLLVHALKTALNGLDASSDPNVTRYREDVRRILEGAGE